MMKKPSVVGRSTGFGYVISLLTVVVILVLAAYRHLLPLPLSSELVRTSGSGDGDGSSHNITIVDFFKPFDPAHPTSVPSKDYYRRINLRPLSPYGVASVNFTDWVDEQFEVSFEYLLSNVADSNFHNGHLLSQGVTEGVIIASPSKKAPDYFYQWIRDSAITIRSVISNMFVLNSTQVYDDVYYLNATLAATVLKYINNSYVLQRLDNLSGDGVKLDQACQLKGLGEPKWHVDNQPFMEPWGRPQNDGPPLRAVAILHFLDELNQQGLEFSDIIDQCNRSKLLKGPLPFSDERELFEKVIYWDLQFVLKNWLADSFDLWEEVNGKHFFTSIVQFAAIRMGLRFLEEHPDYSWESFDKTNLSDALRKCVEQMLQFLTLGAGFLNPNKNYIVETPSILNSRSGLDIAVIIGTLLTTNYADKIPFGVTDSGVLNTLYHLVKSMGIIYPINHPKANLNIGVALGRYPEDVYDGVGTSEGNPWFLATCSASELLYQLILASYHAQTDLVIPLNKWESEFWTLIFDGFDDYNRQSYQLVIPWGTPAFTQTMISVFDLGESFLDVVREHVSEGGQMSEQFNKYTGYLQGAANLTWSYGALWKSCHARAQAQTLIGLQSDGDL